MVTKGWDIPKRFLKYSESLLETPEEKNRIQAFLKALREVYSSAEIHYFIGDTRFRLGQGKIKSSKEPHPASEPQKLNQGEGGHLLFLPPNKLKGNKQKYLQLVLDLYCQTQAGSSSKQKTEKAAQRSHYRLQKERILRIQNHLQRQNPTSRLHQDLDELPELEEEIIHFQNHMIEELAQAKQTSEKERSLNLRLTHFFSQFLDELWSKNSLIQGWFHLQPPVETRGFTKELQPHGLILSQLHETQRFLANLNLVLEAGEAPPTKDQHSFVDLCHQVMEEMAEGEDEQNITFELSPELGQRKIPGHGEDLRNALIFLLEYFARLHEAATPEANLEIRFRAPRLGLFILELPQMELPKELESWLVIPEDLSHSLNYGFQAPSLKLFLCSWLLERNGAKLTLIPGQPGLIAGHPGLIAEMDFRK